MWKVRFFFSENHSRGSLEPFRMSGKGSEERRERGGEGGREGERGGGGREGGDGMKGKLSLCTLMLTRIVFTFYFPVFKSMPYRADASARQGVYCEFWYI